MLASELIAIVREDYLDDAIQPYKWSQAGLLRKLTEAERQACNRANLLYDDTTATLTQITLVDGQSTYSLSNTLTTIENIILDDKYIIKSTKETLDSILPSWRTDTGMTNKTCYAVIQGRTIKFIPEPDANDADKIVYLECYRLPVNAIEDADQEFEIPVEFHRDLIWWVLHECYRQQDSDMFNQEKSDYFLNKFNQIFGEPVSAKVRQHQFENPRSLTIRPVSYLAKKTTVDDDW